MSPIVPCPAEPHGLCPHQPRDARAWISSERSKCLCSDEASLCMWTWCSTQATICHRFATPAVHVLFTSAKGTGKMVFSPSGHQEGKEERQCCKCHSRKSLQEFPDHVELSLRREANPNSSYSYRSVRAWLGPFWSQSLPAAACHFEEELFLGLP